MYESEWHQLEKTPANNVGSYINCFCSILTTYLKNKRSLKSKGYAICSTETVQ